MKKLNIIMNERIYQDEIFSYSENIDCKSIVEGLKEKFELKLFARRTSVQKKNKLFFFNIILSSNIFSFLFNIIFSLKYRKNSTYLIISITPYTFFSYLILFFFTKNIFLYLRSDGFKEYSSILGDKWVFLYSFMFYIFTKKVKIISCASILSKGKPFYFIQPSEIDNDWISNRNFQTNSTIKILYIGRLKIEKGIFNLIDLLKNIDDSNINLSIVGEKSDLNKNFNNRINFLDYVSEKKELINLYDTHDILILPSYTEAHPKVLDEALSRLKPVIIFDDIKHIINGRLGVFSLERESRKLKETIYYIINNYYEIRNDIKKNTLPTKEYFLNNLVNIISNK
jgi:glycosyltransferase involved in cell wall biosynthesis